MPSKVSDTQMYDEWEIKLKKIEKNKSPEKR